MIPYANIFSILKYIFGIVTIASAAFYYYKMEKEVAVLRQNSATYEVAIRNQFDTIQKQERQILEIKKYYKEVASLQTELTVDINNLKDKFNRTSSGKERDLGKLALEKPGLVEKAINNGTEKVFDCFSKAIKGEEDENCSDSASSRGTD